MPNAQVGHKAFAWLHIPIHFSIKKNIQIKIIVVIIVVLLLVGVGFVLSSSKNLKQSEKKQETINDWLEEKIAKTYIKLGDSLKDCTFDQKWAL